MKPQIIIHFVITLIVASSCVSSSKYNDLQNEYEDLQYRYEELDKKYGDLLDEHVEKCREAMELREEYDELEMKYQRLRNKASEACQDYSFWGATHFFTRTAMTNLESVL